MRGVAFWRITASGLGGGGGGLCCASVTCRRALSAKYMPYWSRGCHLGHKRVRVRLCLIPLCPCTGPAYPFPTCTAFLSLGRLCQWSPRTVPVSLCIGPTRRRATVSGGGGSGTQKSKSLGTQIAQINISFRKFHFFPL